MALPVTRVKANPTVGGSTGVWGGDLNAIIDELFAAINTETLDEIDTKVALRVLKAGDTMTGLLTINSGGLTVSGGGARVTAGGLLVSGGGSELRGRLKQESTRAGAASSLTVAPDMSLGNVFTQTASSNGTVQFNAPTNQPAASGLQVAYIYFTADAGGNAVGGSARQIDFPAALSASDTHLIRLVVGNGVPVYQYIGTTA